MYCHKKTSSDISEQVAKSEILLSIANWINKHISTDTVSDELKTWDYSDFQENKTQRIKPITDQ